MVCGCHICSSQGHEEPHRSSHDYGRWRVISLFTKQKVNANNSTEAELFSVDDVIAKILCIRKFIEWQDFEVILNILYKTTQAR